MAKNREGLRDFHHVSDVRWMQGVFECVCVCVCGGGLCPRPCPKPSFCFDEKPYNCIPMSKWQLYGHFRALLGTRDPLREVSK